ncbi:MAG: UDP-N-acetylglucosamine pyrophosphorylase [Deltaproteobacteria bacterium]|nr:UDP-N-acetylglucosamine pyrophosphorylase [Deltaproteobacteria bacterium]
MNPQNKDKILAFIRKGVSIPSPENVLIGDEVSLDRISGNSVTIYPGSKIFGEKTLIMAGVKLGYEGPVTVENCQLGPDVELKGGFFRESSFLEKVNVGSAAQVREGCILEEQANGAHAVGLKQTILFPFVTLGSLINFCDCFMAGGTNRKNHSEVGSSYIHFNYTANQDKATASLIGDVPRGVMLNQAPIFLGGQGGLVGPVRVEYGSVIGAGVICRRDILEGDKLVLAQGSYQRQDEPQGCIMDFSPCVYWQVKQKVLNNINYIANLVALRHWYMRVRSVFFRVGPMDEILYEGVLDKLDSAIRERIRRLKGLAERMPRSAELYREIANGRLREKLLTQKDEFFKGWQDLEALFLKNIEDPGDPSSWESFVSEIDRSAAKKSHDYLAVIRGLSDTWKLKGSKWLQEIVDRINKKALEIMPSYKEHHG